MRMNFEVSIINQYCQYYLRSALYWKTCRFMHCAMHEQKNHICNKSRDYGKIVYSSNATNARRKEFRNCTITEGVSSWVNHL